MAKQLITLIALTTGVIFFSSELNHLLNFILQTHRLISQALHVAFSEGKIGVLIQNIIAVLLIPLICGLIAAAIHWLFKRTSPSHTMSVVWVVWLVLIVAVTLRPSFSQKTSYSKHHKLHVAMN